MTGRDRSPSAVIFGCGGLELDEFERGFFRDVNPLGFILFARNIDSPDQVAALVRELRECVGDAEALILIDQEGGRVARLRPPHWRAVPPANVFGLLAAHDLERAKRAAKLNSRLIADDLRHLGINVDCLPVLDLRFEGKHDIVGDRAYGTTVESVVALGRAACEGLLDGGVLPVIKHIPGHGRAMVDSHLELPTVSADRSALEERDFAPFQALSDMPLAMTAHILYTSLDADRAATLSPSIVGEIIRGHIGYDGLLVTDDLSMKALGGRIGARAADSLAAGCDVVLHCNGDAAEMQEIATTTRALDGAGSERLARAFGALGPPQPFDRAKGLDELAGLLAPVLPQS